MSDYYLDPEHASGNLTGTLTFTNGSTTVTGSGTLFASELAAGDYIKSTDATDGEVWYYVASIASDTELTINALYVKGTHSAAAVYNRGDGSQANPYCHLKQALEDAPLTSGDVVHLQLGKTLYLAFYVSGGTNGYTNNRIYITGDDWQNTGTADPFFTIDGLSTTQNAIYINLTNAKNNVIKNIKLINIEEHNRAVLATYYSDNLILENLRFENNITASMIQAQRGHVVAKDISCYNCYYYRTPVISLSAYVSAEIDGVTVENGPDRNPSCVVKAEYNSPVVIRNVDIQNGTTKLFYGSAPTNWVDSHPFTCHGVAHPNGLFYREYGGILPTYLFIDEQTAHNQQCAIVNYPSYTFGSGNTAAKISLGLSFTEYQVPLLRFTVNLAAGVHDFSYLVATHGLASFPTANDLYIVVYYKTSSSVAASVVGVKSTEAVTANDVETALTASVNIPFDQPVVIELRTGFSFPDIDTQYLLTENGITIT